MIFLKSCICDTTNCNDKIALFEIPRKIDFPMEYIHFTAHAIYRKSINFDVSV